MLKFPHFPSPNGSKTAGAEVQAHSRVLWRKPAQAPETWNEREGSGTRGFLALPVGVLCPGPSYRVME